MPSTRNTGRILHQEVRDAITSTVSAYCDDDEDHTASVEEDFDLPDIEHMFDSELRSSFEEITDDFDDPEDFIKYLWDCHGVKVSTEAASTILKVIYRMVTGGSSL
jgi:hypothetical protein